MGVCAGLSLAQDAPQSAPLAPSLSRTPEETRQSASLVVTFDPPGCSVELRRMNGKLVGIASRSESLLSCSALFRLYDLGPNGSGFVIRVHRPGYRAVERGVIVLPRSFKREYFALCPEHERRRLAVLEHVPGGVRLLSLWPDGGSQAALPLAVEGLADPAWSPDGSRLAFAARDLRPTTDIFLWDVASRRQMRLTQSPDSDHSPTWSLDSQRIAFVRERGERDKQADVFVIGADGTGEDCLTFGTWRSNEIDPCFSPDGEEVVYASDRDGTFDIFAQRLDGTGIRKLTHAPGDETDPAWCPTRSVLAYVARSADGQTIEFLDLSAGEPAPTRMTACGADKTAAEPAWSTDGQYLAFTVYGDGGPRVNVTARGLTWAAPLGLPEQRFSHPSWCRLAPEPGLPPLVAIAIAGRGEIFVELDSPSGPQFAEHFLSLVDEGFYNGLTVYRSVPEMPVPWHSPFLLPFGKGLSVYRRTRMLAIEMGCPLGNGTGRSERSVLAEGKPVPIERGSVALIVDTDGRVYSRFLIALQDMPTLTGQVLGIGHVVAGLDVAEQVVTGDRVEIIARRPRE